MRRSNLPPYLDIAFVLNIFVWASVVRRIGAESRDRLDQGRSACDLSGRRNHAESVDATDALNCVCDCESIW